LASFIELLPELEVLVTDVHLLTGRAALFQVLDEPDGEAAYGDEDETCGE
jgi:hypothetical protein